MSLDEEQILEKVLSRTGVRERIAEEGVTIDAPEGWIRLVTTFGSANEIDVVTRANLGLVHLESALAHVCWDASNHVVRIAASLPAVTDAPLEAAVLGTLDHLAAVKTKIVSGEGEIRATAISSPSSPSAPTLADVARVMGNALALVPEKDAWVGGLREPKSGIECALRLHTPLPGIFAADAWLLPPKRTEPEVALFDRLDAMNVSSPAGVMFLVPGQSFVLYRWSCPYAWLALDQFEAPALAYTALAAFHSFTRM